MLKITNISHTPQRFTTSTGRRVEIEPGESENVAVDPDNVRVKAKLNAGLITLAEQRKAAGKPASTSSPREQTTSEE